MNKPTQEKTVIIHTDGACRGNPGIGGWGATLEYGAHKKEIYGFDPATTSNKMELTAAIRALKALKMPCKVIIYTDSQYLQLGITKWIYGWKKKNWANVKNVELWQELERATLPHQIEWIWVRGHNGHLGNERADYLANYAIDNRHNVSNIQEH